MRLRGANIAMIAVLLVAVVVAAIALFVPSAAEFMLAIAMTDVLAAGMTIGFDVGYEKGSCDSRANFSQDTNEE